MISLLDLAKKSENPVKPFGHTDVLLLYGMVGDKLRGFLHGKEIASKVWLPKGNIKYFLNRGSKKPPLYVDDLVEAITPEFLEIRSEHHLKEVETEITEKQKLVWLYFPPRKLADFFYATNSEGAGKPIDRIFFDIDRGEGVSFEHAREVAKLLCETIRKDSELRKLIGKTKPFVSWTGNSFHVYIMLSELKPNSFYERYFMFSKNDPLASFTGRWAEEIKNELKINVSGGHEKIPNHISIDPSQTPSGKLCRSPLGSLHMADAKTIDGVSVPLTEEMLGDNNLEEKLKEITPAYVIKNLEKLAERLPRMPS
ncbi:MAG: hypothetical protein J7K72_04025 [Candidatus Aenigmarchaeota archaeon]|nr:hypothetical protein [Candidatus Aenigmarchaeota archaeon]